MESRLALRPNTTTTYWAATSLTRPGVISRHERQPQNHPHSLFTTTASPAARKKTDGKRLDSQLQSLFAKSSGWEKPSRDRRSAASPVLPQSAPPPPPPPPTSRSPPGYGSLWQQQQQQGSSAETGYGAATVPRAKRTVQGTTVSWDQINASQKEEQQQLSSKARRDREADQKLKQQTNATVTDMHTLVFRQGVSSTPLHSTYGAEVARAALGPHGRPFFRRKPETGKMIAVRGTLDLGGAMAVLGAQVAQNKLRETVRFQLEHERPGKKRKRLRSDRWKKCFSEGFKAAVLRANQLSKMGW